VENSVKLSLVFRVLSLGSLRSRGRRILREFHRVGTLGTHAATETVALAARYSTDGMFVVSILG